MRPCLRSRRTSAEPRASRACTASLTRSPAIPARKCSYDAVESRASRRTRRFRSRYASRWKSRRAALRSTAANASDAADRRARSSANGPATRRRNQSLELYVEAREAGHLPPTTPPTSGTAITMPGTGQSARRSVRRRSGACPYGSESPFPDSGRAARKAGEYGKRTSPGRTAERAHVAARATDAGVPGATSPGPPPRIAFDVAARGSRSEEHTSELQSHSDLVCRLLLEKKKKTKPRPQHANNKNLPNNTHNE